MKNILTNTINNEDERVVLVKLIQNEDDEAAHASLRELERLTESAGGFVVARLVQNKDVPNAATYIGSGKAFELAELCRNCEVTLAIFDNELTPSQIKNLENILGNNVRVIDRSMLILDIFALHAQSGEGKLQVELAQLKYTVPRLIGKGLELSRQGGGFIAARGPGESKLETDRRHINRRVYALESQIKTLEKNRLTQRNQRDRSGLCKVTIAGYTNAGKSTLLNYLTDARILAQDKLFATLDPTTRRFRLENGRQILLTDTVGFIRNLPHHFVKAFKSTLDEVKFADIIIVLMDGSDPDCLAQGKVTTELLLELNVGGKPMLYVYNKCDLLKNNEYGSPDYPPIPEGVENDDVFYISSHTGAGIDRLLARISQIIESGEHRSGRVEK